MLGFLFCSRRDHMANVGIRKYLNDQGYNDNQIGYNNGQVTLNGKNFYGATPQAVDDASHGMMAGSTYGDQNALANALKTYQGNDRNTMLKDTLGNVNSAVNTKDPFQFKQTQEPFQYNNPQADPLYQAAMRQATQGAQTATNNAMVGLGSRGIGNSSVAVDRANQIQQKAIGNVNDTVLPQLMQQAYQRYQDQNNNDYRNQVANYGVGQDQVHNQSSFANTLNGLNQQQTDNSYRDNALAEQVKGNNYDAYLKSVGLTGNLGTGPKSDYSLLGGTDGPLSLQGQQLQDNQAQQVFENKLKTQLQNANLTNMSADNARALASEARQAGSQKYAQLFDAWDRTGQAPAGLEGLGIQAGKTLNKGGNASPKIGEKESANNYNTILGDLNSDGITKDQAIALVKANVDYLSDSDYKKALELVQNKF
jgi:hypothetical protein